METNNFIKKVYTVAFRLTGDVTKADYLAFKAINASYSTLKLSDMETSHMFEKSVMEVFGLFLSESKNTGEVFKIFKEIPYDEPFQEALMSLKPLSRATVVWRDVLGRSLEEMNMIGYNKKELYSELNNGRRFIKELLNEKYIKKTGA